MRVVVVSVELSFLTRKLSLYLFYPSYKINMADSKHSVRKYLYSLSDKTDPIGKNDIEVYSVLKVTPNIDSTEASKRQDVTSVKSIEGDNGQECIETSKNQDSKSDKSPTKCIINIGEFLEGARSYVYLVVEGRLLEDPRIEEN